MSSQPASPIANPDQQEFWNSVVGQTWVEHQEALDAVMQSIADRLLERAAPAAGERVLDVGCGAGATTLALAARVAPDGMVLGVDISRPLVDRAIERMTATGIGGTEYVLADAQTYAFPPGRFDLMASRFGVMFFADPVAAFGNIRSALRPGGRASFVSWASMADNPWFNVSREAAIQRLGAPPATDPRAPGPMAFAETDYVLGILTGAGFAEPSAEVEEIGMIYPGTVAEAAAFVANIGPAGRIVREREGTAEDVAAITAATAERFGQYATGAGVRIPATLNFFAAVRP